MHFLCLCHYNLQQFSRFTPQDFQRMQALCEPHDRALRESGHLVAVGSLSTPDKFLSLKAAKGQAVATTQAPYAATAEPFGAFFIIEAADMEAAARVARLHPGVHLSELCDGGIEIRPIERLDLLQPPA